MLKRNLIWRPPKANARALLAFKSTFHSALGRSEEAEVCNSCKIHAQPCELKFITVAPIVGNCGSGLNCCAVLIKYSWGEERAKQSESFRCFKVSVMSLRGQKVASLNKFRVAIRTESICRTDSDRN